MLFAFDITIPANTLESAPTLETLKIAAGVITNIAIKFPSGCHGLVKVRIRHEETQIYPIPRGEWVTGDDETVPAEYYYDMGKASKELEFIAISPDTTYDHTITVRITILPLSVVSPLKVMEDLVAILKRILGIK